MQGDSDDDLESILGSITVKKAPSAPAPKVVTASLDSTMKDFLRSSSNLTPDRRPQSPAEPRQPVIATPVYQPVSPSPQVAPQSSSVDLQAILTAIQSLELQRAKIREEVETEYKGRLAEMERRMQREYEVHVRNAEIDTDSQRRASEDRSHLSELVTRVSEVAQIFQSEQQKLLAAKDRFAAQRETELIAGEAEVKQEKARVSELMSQLGASTKALTDQAAAEARRLDEEHSRLVQLEHTTKEVIDSHKGVMALKSAAIEAGKRELADERIAFAAEKRRTQEELEQKQKQAAAEWEKLRQAKLEVELLLSSCASRVHATEAGLDENRKALIREVESIEDKRKKLNSDMASLKLQQTDLAEQKAIVEDESRRLADAAIRVNMKSEEVLLAFNRAVNARDEVMSLCEEVNKEKENLQDESEKLRALQNWIESEKLQVLRAQKSGFTGEVSPVSHQFNPQSTGFKLNLKKQINEESRKWDRLRKEAEEFDSMVDDMHNKSMSARSSLKLN